MTQRYDTYKDSGVQWLGEIPGHWETLRAKHMFNKEQRPVEEGDEIVTCFRDGEVTLRKNRRTTGYTEATDQRCSDRTNKSMLSYGHIKNRTIIVDWLVKKDKRAIELENENTNVKPIPGSWNTVFNREVEQLFIILV